MTVNRYWQQYFGTGLVKTSEDFGSQGEWPSHPELLDWLAAEFIDSGWNVKALQKLIVMSAAYRQSSHVDAEQLTHDPDNRLLARGPRFRLDAEMIRDNALCGERPARRAHRRAERVSLSAARLVGSRWASAASFSSQSYVQSHGRDLYRRGIYVYLETGPALSAAGHVRRAEPRGLHRQPGPHQHAAASPGAAERSGLCRSGPRAGPARSWRRGQFDDRASGLAFAFKLCTARAPQAGRSSRSCCSIYQAQSARFQQDPEAADKLISVGESPRPADVDLAELAAWTAVGNVLLNLDETITKG